MWKDKVKLRKRENELGRGYDIPCLGVHERDEQRNERVFSKEHLHSFLQSALELIVGYQWPENKVGTPQLL